MQKIMVPAKLWCDHTEGFEIRTEILGAGRRRECWNLPLTDAVKVHSDDEYGFLRNSLQLGTYAKSTGDKFRGDLCDLFSCPLQNHLGLLAIWTQV